jgi:hypothetical protein
MTQRDPELQYILARLRQAGGPALAPGQTPCCYAFSVNHPLLRALDRILDAIVPSRKREECKEQTPRKSSGCCGGPAPAGTDACCKQDADIKARGEDGCGCATAPMIEAAAAS